MKKQTITLLSLAYIASLSSCAIVTVPLKVVGKAATTTVGVAGKVAGAGVNAVTPNRDDSEE